MLEIGTDEIQTLAMDHHGLVAAVCKDLGIAEKINRRIENKDERRVDFAGKSRCSDDIKWIWGLPIAVYI